MVTLIEWTANPDAVVYVLWHASRTDEPLMSVDEVAIKQKTDSDFNTKVMRTFDDVVGASIPVSEAVRFTFMFENITVAWREQLVRHRTNSYWSQSSRARPLHNFYDEEIFWTPEEIRKDPGSLDIWSDHMRDVQERYRKLEKRGISRDNARGVLPQYMTHRISGTFSLRHLADLIKARTCWVAQSDLWGPIIHGMLSEIAKKVDANLAAILGSPPCAKAGQYYHCPIGPDNDHRLKGEDPEPPCPLWLHQIGHVGPFYKSERARSLMERFEDMWHPNLVKIAEYKMEAV